MEDTRIRRAGPADLNDFLALWRFSRQVQDQFRRMRVTIDPDQAFREQFLSTIDAPGDTWLAAEVDGRVVGMAFLHSDRPSRVSDEEALEISRVSVDPAVQGRGVGRALVAEAERIARERGMAFLSAKIFSGNADALSFWKRLEFEPLFETHLRRLD